MKKISISFFAIILLSLLFISCGKDCHENFVGEWSLNRTVKQGFLEDEFDDGSVVGSLIINQEILYAFFDDLSYEKRVTQTIVDVEKAENIENENENYALLKESIGNSNHLIFTGTYKANEKKLKLVSERLNLNGEDFDYKEYYTTNPHIGLQKVVFPYKIEDKILTLNNFELNIEEVFTKIK